MDALAVLNIILLQMWRVGPWAGPQSPHGICNLRVWMPSSLCPLTGSHLLTWTRWQVCGSDGLPCAALRSPKLQTSVQLGSVLTLVGRDPWEKFLPPNGQRIPSQWVGAGVGGGWKGGSPQNSFLLRNPRQVIYPAWVSLSHLQSGSTTVSPWFSCREGPPEVTLENCRLHWPAGSSSSHPYFPSPRVIFEGVPTSSPINKIVKKWSISCSKSCVWLFATSWTWLLCPWDSPDKNTGVGCHSLLQGTFQTQGANPGLLHCRQILYQLSHQGNPNINKITHSKTIRAAALQCLHMDTPIREQQNTKKLYGTKNNCSWDKFWAKDTEIKKPNCQFWRAWSKSRVLGMPPAYSNA